MVCLTMTGYAGSDDGDGEIHEGRQDPERDVYASGGADQDGGVGSGCDCPF